MGTAIQKVALAHTIIRKLHPLSGFISVPGRAHELVQQGPHLCLGRHGGAGPEAAAPTETRAGAWGGGGGGSAASAAATRGKR